MLNYIIIDDIAELDELLFEYFGYEILTSDSSGVRGISLETAANIRDVLNEVLEKRLERK